MRAYLVDVELLHEVEVSSLPAQVSLGHGFDALLLQTVHHVIVGVLVWEASKSLTHTNTHTYMQTYNQNMIIVLYHLACHMLD